MKRLPTRINSILRAGVGDPLRGLLTLAGCLALGAAQAQCGQVDLGGLDQPIAEVLSVALSELTTAIDGGAATGDDYGEMGMQLHAQGLHDDALLCYDVAESMRFGDHRWPYLAAHAWRGLGQVERSVEKFKSAIHAQADYAPARVYLAQLSRLSGDSATAVRLLRPLLQTSRDPGVAAAVGETALSLLEFDLAIDWLQQALEMAPTANRLNYLLGQAHQGKGELELAEQYLKAAGTIGVKPLDPVLDAVEARITGDIALVLRGRRAFAAGDFDAAGLAFEQALARNPENTGARINLAVVRAKQGDASGAVEMLEAVLAEHPNSETALFNLAGLLEKSDPQRSVQHYRALIGTATEDGELHLRLGTVIASLGELETATEHLELARRDQGVLEAASVALASLKEQTGDEAAAIQLLKDTLLVTPTSESLNLELARILTYAKDKSLRDGQLSIQLASRVHGIVPSDTSAHILAVGHAEIGDCQGAKKWLQEAASMLPENDSRRAVLSQFARNMGDSDCRP